MVASERGLRIRYGIQPGDPVWMASTRVGGRHLAALLAPFLFPLSWPLATLCVASYLLRIWAMEAVYHRFFAHRAFAANRGVQFLLALVGTQCGQRGALWWAATHRTHHRFADSADDPHTPALRGFTYAHAGWITHARHLATNLDVVADYACYPELRWLNRYYWLPLYLAVPALYCAGAAGWFGSAISGGAAVFWGGFVPTTLALHLTSCVNSLGHMSWFPGGYRRYDGLRNNSTNRPLLALLTLGAGWHNNHHRFSSAARAGFAWYELDVVYWSLVLGQALGLWRQVKGVIPEQVLREGGLTLLSRKLRSLRKFSAAEFGHAPK